MGLAGNDRSVRSLPMIRIRALGFLVVRGNNTPAAAKPG